MKSFKTIPLITIVLMAILAFPAGVLADDDDDDSDGSSKLVGSWEITVTDDSGAVFIGLFTYGGEGTLTASPPGPGFSTGHGAWEQDGPGDFSSTFVSFIFDPSGLLRVTNRNTIEVSSGGQSLTLEFEAEVSLVDGTVVDTVSGTGAGTRINVESF